MHLRSRPSLNSARTALLHLLPGLFISIANYLAAPAAMRAGLPAEAAFLLSVVFIGWPTIYAVLQRSTAGREGGWSAVLPYRRPMPAWQYALFVPALIGVAFAVLPLGQMVSAAMSRTVFAWAPGWVLDNDANPFGQPAKQVVLATLVLKLLIDGIANPIVEELYFRGHLLPRLAALGFGAPILNTALFALGHGWQPQNAVLIFLIFLPTATVAWWRRNMYLPMYVHVALNTIGTVLSMIDLFNGG